MLEDKIDEVCPKMTNINWFPGHMSKALKMMENELKTIDVIIYVLDSRAPFSCVNPKFTKLIGDKPIIYAFNKVDLVDRENINLWQKFFQNKNNKCILLNSVSSGATKKLVTLINELCMNKIIKLREKNINATLRAMVIGVPNSGKSTLINNLCGKAKTVAKNIAGVTKCKQWIKIADNLEILDTPGTLWPAFDNDLIAHHLAYIGSIKEDVLDLAELSLDFINEIINNDKSILENRYNIVISIDDSPLSILENICKSKNLIVKGGDFDYDRGAKMIINDFKSGRMGNIILETVEDVKKLLINNRQDRKLNKY